MLCIVQKIRRRSTQKIYVEDDEPHEKSYNNKNAWTRYVEDMFNLNP